MGGNGKRRWKISIFRSSSSSSSSKDPPKEFLCPISGCLMFEPVVVSSGQTFERASVQVCRDLGFTTTFPDQSIPDFSTVIPNLALKTTILHWCDASGSGRPQAPNYKSLENTVRTLMAAATEAEAGAVAVCRDEGSKIRVSERELLEGVAEKPPVVTFHAASELGPRAGNLFYSSSSEESVIANVPATPLLPFTTRPACYSSSSTSSSASNSSSEIVSEDRNPSGSSSSSSAEVEFLTKFKCVEVFEQEQGVVTLRKLTRSSEEARASLCSPRLLSAIKPLLISRYVGVQTNAAAALVNLSLEKLNKVKIVRAGIVPILIDLLKGGFAESQEHSAGAIFSLALEDDNKTAIGVLGALQPLLHALRSAESERTRHDSALALYHLSIVQSNRVRLVKLGAITTLLTMLRGGELAGKVLLILCNLAASAEGRSAMLDGNGVECLVGLLRRGPELDSEVTRENCVAALYSLSHGSMRFRGLAREARAAEVLREVAESGSERAKLKAKQLLAMLRGREEEELDWEGVLEGRVSRTRHGLGMNECGANSTEF